MNKEIRTDNIQQAEKTEIGELNYGIPVSQIITICENILNEIVDNFGESEEERKKLVTRLKKVEGQIRGIEKMVEEDAYCPDILMQVAAATSALNSFSKVLLSCHIKSCVKHDIQNGNDETIDELCELLQRLMK